MYLHTNVLKPNRLRGATSGRLHLSHRVRPPEIALRRALPPDVAQRRPVAARVDQPPRVLPRAAVAVPARVLRAAATRSGTIRVARRREARPVPDPQSRELREGGRMTRE